MLSGDKALDTSFACKKQGHWHKDCPTKTPTKSESENGEASLHIPVLYCPCGRGICTILTSRTEKNPNRKFYTCPISKPKDCKFFKWVDELKVKAPHCPCGAGVCSIQTVTSGDYKGKKFFACRIQKGQGACSFFQWVDSPEDVKMNDSGKGIMSYSPAASASFQINNTASDLCKRDTLLVSNPATATSVSFQKTSTVSDSYNGATLVTSNLAPDTLLASNSVPGASTSCQITNASDTCDGRTLLDIHPTELLGVGNPRYTPERISVAEGMKLDNIPGILASESLSQSDVVAPKIVSSNFNNVARDQTAETNSSNLVMSKDLCNGHLESETQMYPQQTKFLRKNLGLKGSSTEVQSSIPLASSGGLRSPSSACGGYSQLLESRASHTPEYPGHRLHGHMCYELNNRGHYKCIEEIPYGLMTHIEQLNRENGELKSEIKILKNQVAAYVEKENAKVPELRGEIVDEKIKELVNKLWLMVLIFAVVVTYFKK